MIDKQLLPGGIEVSAEDLAKTPPSVLKLLMYLLEEKLRLKKKLRTLKPDSIRMRQAQ